MNMRKQTLQKAHQWTILDVLTWTAEYFSANHIDSPRLTAEILLAETIGVERIDLYVRFEQPLTEDERNRFRELVKRRVRREPTAYILGRKDFWTIGLEVTPDVLVPRPETEFLVEVAIERIDEAQAPFMRIFDMGTGSGAIAISLASCRTSPVFFASDSSPAALGVAARNAAANAVAARIRFFASRWFDAVSQNAGFDMIVSNPPYIPTPCVTELEPEVRDFEPAAALDGGRDGLRDIAFLIKDAPEYLRPSGTLLLEIGHDQKEAVEALASRNQAFGDVFFRKDYEGHHRVAVLKKG